MGKTDTGWKVPVGNMLMGLLASSFQVTKQCFYLNEREVLNKPLHQ